MRKKKRSKLEYFVSASEVAKICDLTWTEKHNSSTLPVICSFPFTLARCQILLGERSFDLYVGSHFLQQKPVQQLRSFPRELAVLNVKHAVSYPLQNLLVCNNRAVKGGIWGSASSVNDDE